MWQALLAAAVAGSTGIVAKHFFKPTTPSAADNDVPKPYHCDHRDQDHDHEEDNENEGTQFWGASAFGSDQLGLPHASICEDPDGVFRFSSTENAKGVGVVSKNLSKKRVGLGRKLKKGVGFERSTGLELEQRSVRRFGVCLKRRKTSKNGAGTGKRETCSSNDTSLFGWGLGVGIMYMMSAGKAEFSKLNAAVNETAQVVQELKTELHKRKSSQNLQGAGCASEVISNHDTPSCNAHPSLNKSSTDKIEPNEINSFNHCMIIEGECASSVLTEEHGLGVQEMDQLEAELEFELQRLPCCTSEASNQEVSTDLVETKVSAQRFPKQEKQDSDTHQLCGVLPAELDQKLCHLLIERQENQIEELESELNVAQRKLHEKEAELQALKDCVKRLTEFSLSTLTDDETEAEIEQVQTRDWNYKKIGSESKEPGVGMKRPIDSKIM